RVGLYPVPKEIKESSLDSAERKVKPRHTRRRKRERVRIPLSSVLIDERSSGIRKSHDLSRLVECFACSIILCLADDLHVEWRLDAHKLSMSSTDREAQKRKPGMRFADEVRQHVRLHMVDLNQGDVQRRRHPFGE